LAIKNWYANRPLILPRSGNNPTCRIFGVK
jgi:hypothetical protein